jgi:hypothetical protein
MITFFTMTFSSGLFSRRNFGIEETASGSYIIQTQKHRSNIFEPKIVEVLRSKTPPNVPRTSGVLPSKQIEALKFDAR